MSDNKSNTYEEAFSRIDNVSKSLQAGDLKVDELISLLPELTADARLCKSKLSELNDKINAFKEAVSCDL